MKAIRGCKKPAEKPAVYGEYQSVWCPRKNLQGETLNYIEAFYQYRKGFLPNEGTWLNQPMKIWQVFNLIESVIERYGEGVD